MPDYDSNAPMRLPLLDRLWDDEPKGQVRSANDTQRFARQAQDRRQARPRSAV